MADGALHAGDVMTPNVISVPPEAKVSEVARILLECHITGVPVVGSDGRPMGMVSETDIERLSDQPDVSAAEVMTGGVATVREDAGLDQVRRIFDQRHVRRAVVVRDDGRMQGIVTRSDLLKGVAQQWDKAGLPAEPDMDVVRQRVAEVLDRYAGTTSAVKVVIVEGVAHLWGTVDSDNERRAVHGAVATVAGVLGVDDHLIVYRGPMP